MIYRRCSKVDILQEDSPARVHKPSAAPQPTVRATPLLAPKPVRIGFFHLAARTRGACVSFRGWMISPSGCSTASIPSPTGCRVLGHRGPNCHKSPRTSFCPDVGFQQLRVNTKEHARGVVWRELSLQDTARLCCPRSLCHASPTAMGESSRGSTSPPAFGAGSALGPSRPQRRVMVSRCCCNLHVPMTCDVACLLAFLFQLYTFSSEQVCKGYRPIFLIGFHCLFYFLKTALSRYNSHNIKFACLKQIINY